MPELPEVETIRKDLEKMLAGKTVKNVDVRDIFVLTGFLPKGLPRRKVSISDFRRSIEGQKVKRFLRRGKYLVMEFADGTAVIFHLRMTGQLLVGCPNGKARAIMEFSGGHTLSFLDHRRFGEILFSADWKNEPCIRSLGIEPLSNDLTAERLKGMFMKKQAKLHSILLNQGLVSGLGNIYATEALFKAKISPFRQACKVSAPELKKLAAAIKWVLEKSIMNRGFSMSTYVDALGKKGKSQLYALCYGKKGEPCAYCRKPLEKTVIAGRGVVYCPICQI